ncbi:MAG: hypothetical protein Fur0032_20210 [Terrimicrobiaceae bacterium]
MTTAPNTERTDDRLIVELKKIHEQNDRGSLALLRGWWSPATKHRAWPVFGRLIAYRPEQHAPGYYLADEMTAALFAVHCRRELLHLPGVSLGRCCLQLAGGSQKAAGFEAFERHFMRLLASDSLEDLGDQLHGIIKRAERESTPLDYNRLLWDLRTWNKNSDEIKNRWAIDFWQAPAELQPSTDS